jgi:hypothetical protein
MLGILAVTIGSSGNAFCQDQSADDWITTGGNTYLTTGNVGIGMEPVVKLDIQTSSVGDPILRGRNSSGNVILDVDTSTPNDHGIMTLKNNAGGISFQVHSGGNAYFTRNVGIHTSSPGYALDVAGTIRAEEVKVETGWSDYVFEGNYKLRPLDEVEDHIKRHKHLPDIPSAQEIKENGLNIAEMMSRQMQKIEELTLYMIDLKKENAVLKARMGMLEDKE